MSAFLRMKCFILIQKNLSEVKLLYERKGVLLDSLFCKRVKKGDKTAE